MSSTIDTSHKLGLSPEFAERLQQMQDTLDRKYRTEIDRLTTERDALLARVADLEEQLADLRHDACDVTEPPPRGRVMATSVPARRMR